MIRDDICENYMNEYIRSVIGIFIESYFFFNSMYKVQCLNFSVSKL